MCSINAHHFVKLEAIHSSKFPVILTNAHRFTRLTFSPNIEGDTSKHAQMILFRESSEVQERQYRVDQNIVIEVLKGESLQMAKFIV
jgi:hypothetical protein